MFFNNKEENIDQEVVNDETPKDDFIVSEYAIERYKKSDHCKVSNLSNEEIELLFCDKCEYGNVNYEDFTRILSKVSFNYAYEWIVFPPKFYL